MNLKEKLIEIRKEIPYLRKDTKGYNYRYVSGVSVLTTIQKKMNELKVLLYPDLAEGRIIQFEITDRKGNSKINFRFECNGFYIFSDAESDDILQIPFFFTGIQDDSSKALGSALTYSERYFLLKFFNIATDNDDPDTFQEKHFTKNTEKSYKSVGNNKETEKKTNPLFEIFKIKMRKLYKELGKDKFFAKLGSLGYEKVEELENAETEILDKVLKEMKNAE